MLEKRDLSFSFQGPITQPWDALNPKVYLTALRLSIFFELCLLLFTLFSYCSTLLVATGRVPSNRDSDSHGTENTAATAPTLFHWPHNTSIAEGDEG